MGPSHLSGLNSFKPPGPADKPHRSLLEGRRDLFAPSEAGYTSDATDFTDFSDEEGSEIDLDSPAEPAHSNLVEFSADSIGEAPACPSHMFGRGEPLSFDKYVMGVIKVQFLLT